jgi:hypothetical protein
LLARFGIMSLKIIQQKALDPGAGHEDPAQEARSDIRLVELVGTRDGA